MGRLLDRYDAMQRRPFGTNTALTAPENNNPAVSQLRRQEKAYGQALRLLTRRARRGDVNSALSAIGVRDKAMEAGFTPGGIRNNEQAEAGLQGIVGNMERRAADMEAASGMTRQQAMEETRVAPVDDTRMAPVSTPGLDRQREEGIGVDRVGLSERSDAMRRREKLRDLKDNWAHQTTVKDTAEAKERSKFLEQQADYDKKYGETDDRMDEMVNNLDPEKFTSEQQEAIRKNMRRLSPKDRKDSIQQGYFR